MKTIRNSFFVIAISFLLLSFGYSRLSKNIPIAYYDEQWWIWDSGVIQHFLAGNFDEKVWDTYTSLDQPNFTKFVFGVWLYPQYLNFRKDNPDKDYIHFLITHGFYYDDGIYPYESYLKEKPKDVVGIQRNEIGFPNEILRIHGENVRKNLDTILYVRKLSFLLLAAAATVLFWFFWKQKGFWFSAAFLIFYGFNSLLVESGVKAQTVALFLLLFNSSLVAMFLYFLRKEKIRYLVLFSILTGLCFSTKLNGIMPVIVYFVIAAPKLLKKIKIAEPKIFSLKLFLPMLLPTIIFTVLNPFTYPNPPAKFMEMIKWRQLVSDKGADFDFEKRLPNLKDRAVQTFRNFYGSETVYRFNGVGLNNKYNIPGMLLLILFLTGLISEVKNAENRNTLSYLMGISFLVTFAVTSSYLVVNWVWYFVHLIFFFVYYQLIGLSFYFKMVVRNLNLNEKARMGFTR